MASLDEISLRYRLFFKAYRWRRIDPVPWTPLERPVSECRVGLVSSAGLALPGQEPFDQEHRGGDPTFREVPADAPAGDLEDHHRSESYDHSGIHRDPNVAFPLDRLRELAEDGAIGSVAPRHLSFMGSVTAPGRLMRDHAPRAAELLRRDEVDVALLVPV